ncbi:unnamed protein product [Hermetia illucens]|uniref:Peptidase A2 domain-containing protein n=1 Tax=Hermetia illucens TaxID=343691 RepID=A0A7R8UZ84_HERIL|nr:unnamed protein product [Hermetia illucens]
MRIVRSNHLCRNCLKSIHYSITCVPSSCRKCSRKHKTLLHKDQRKKNVTPHTTSESTKNKARNKPPSDKAALLTTQDNQQRGNYVLLSTTKVGLTAVNAQSLECQALLDSGSQVNLITERLVKKLVMTTSSGNLSMQGISNWKQRTQRRINVQLESRIAGF